MASILGSAVLEYVSIRERKVWKGERLKPVSSFSVFGFFFFSGVFGWMLVYHLISPPFQVLISMLTTIHWSSTAFYPETFRSSAKTE